MLFNSLGYIIFFPLVVIIYFLIPHRFRWIFLLAASYYFYLSFRFEYVFLIVISTLSSYYAAILIDGTNNEKNKNLYLVISLIINLGILFFFKYYNFTIFSVNQVLDKFTLNFHFPVLKWILPFGISFYTFQVIGYTLDIYWGSYKPERHLGIYALFVAFFTKLVAGPIERGNRLIPQFYLVQHFEYRRVKDGLLLMMWGYFQKMVIADNLKILVDQVFNNVHKYEGFPLIIGMFAFAFQMYCDFSGYTDIALGSAQILGFDLMKNFDRPFASKNISEFWRRWHISLSSWAGDYLYKPIVFNKRRWKQWAVVYAVAVTFLFLGVWHGAKAAFLIFGVLMGGAFYFELMTTGFRKKIAERVPKAIYNNLSVVLTFMFFCFSSIFFRANTTAEGFTYYGRMFRNIHIHWYQLGINKLQFVSTLIFIFILEYVHHLQKDIKIRDYVASMPLVARWTLYVLLVAVIFNFGEFNENHFIYLDF